MNNISIIMPLYNAEKYLKESLVSILKQTYKEFELICIDDGSTDNTSKILHQFQEQDNRIKIIKNRARIGAAASRNVGIISAQGKYITFLDGDDIVDESIFELAYKEIDECDADIIMYEYIHVLSKDIYKKKSVQRNTGFIRKYCETSFSVLDRKPIEFMNWSASPCNKLYKKSFIISNGLEFQTLTSSNDVYFVSMALLLASKIKMLEDRRVMLYARDHDTVTRISYDRDPMCVYLAMEKIGTEIVVRGLSDKLCQYYYCAVFYYLQNAILKTKNIEKAKQFYHFLQKEGIDNIYKLFGGKYKVNDQYINKLLNNIRQLDFESNWYDIENVLNYHLYKNEKKICSFLQAYVNRNQQIVIWGAGNYGRTLVEFLRVHGIKNIEVVDKDKNKQGSLLKGLLIKSPDEILKNVKVVIASSSTIYKEVLREVKYRNIEIIDIQEMAEAD